MRTRCNQERRLRRYPSPCRLFILHRHDGGRGIPACAGTTEEGVPVGAVTRNPTVACDASRPDCDTTTAKSRDDDIPDGPTLNTVRYASLFERTNSRTASGQQELSRALSRRHPSRARQAAGVHPDVSRGGQSRIPTAGGPARMYENSRARGLAPPGPPQEARKQRSRTQFKVLATRKPTPVYRNPAWYPLRNAERMPAGT